MNIKHFIAQKECTIKVFENMLLCKSVQHSHKMLFLTILQHIYLPLSKVFCRIDTEKKYFVYLKRYIKGANAFYISWLYTFDIQLNASLFFENAKEMLITYACIAY